MKHRLTLILGALALLASPLTFAQGPSGKPSGAPAGATGQCKDGTYSNAASKSGACSGHKGVQTWYSASTTAPKAATATPAPATTPPATPAPATAPVAPVRPATPPAPARPAPSPLPNAAPGGGPGMVWVNTSTNVYHCPGDRYYGKTRAGKYMSESDAKSAGIKADDNKPCKL